MKCPACIEGHRAYCFLDPDRKVPHIVLAGIRIDYTPRVVKDPLAIREAGE